VRGYQKKVIFVKNADSDIFEEAYFVLKSEEKTRFFSHATMVAEARRIIEENFETKKKPCFLNFKVFFAFIVGGLLSFFIALLLL